ncbi:MAG: ABC transporter ATP-binding protein [Bauldia sp.]|nr:ABC transporter ATP-binding protein [Bauldia sp.]
MDKPAQDNRAAGGSFSAGAAWTTDAAPGGAPALAVRDLRKVYATGTEALKGVSLEMPPGDFFALLGPNGAGKTTVIGIVTGIVDKSGGSVSVFGDDIDRHPQAARRHIGVVPQELNFNIFEKVIDIVVTQGGYYGIPRKIAYPRAEEILEQLGLHDKRNDKSMTLSGGMKRRLMIARALIHRPRLLILDEPTAGVDVELRRGMWDFLRRLTAQGTSILLTTHYLEEAEQLCRHVAIINRGQIVAAGTVRDILAQLHAETVVLDLAPGAAERAASLLPAFRAAVADPSTLELEIASGHSLGEAIVALETAGIGVRMARGKAGRLEEVFMKLTAEGEK